MAPKGEEVDMVEHMAVEVNEFEWLPAWKPLAEELQTLLLMLQEHLDQELNSMRAAEPGAEQLLRVQEDILVLKGVGVYLLPERLEITDQLDL